MENQRQKLGLVQKNGDGCLLPVETGAPSTKSTKWVGWKEKVNEGRVIFIDNNQKRTAVDKGTDVVWVLGVNDWILDVFAGRVKVELPKLPKLKKG